MIKICKCDEFCEMNPLFPFHSQRTVGERRWIGAPDEFEQRLITRRRTDFKVWWPQDPAIQGCGAQLNSQAGGGVQGACGLSISRKTKQMEVEEAELGGDPLLLPTPIGGLPSPTKPAPTSPGWLCRLF